MSWKQHHAHDKDDGVLNTSCELHSLLDTDADAVFLCATREQHPLTRGSWRCETHGQCNQLATSMILPIVLLCALSLMHGV